MRDDLLGKARAGTPPVLDYQAIAAERLDAQHAADLRLVRRGPGAAVAARRRAGCAAMGERNRAKAQALYAAIDASGFYRNPVAQDCRSWMNVPFTLATPALDKTLPAEAQAAGLTNLEGHRSVGGMRASLYNAMPLAGVQALIAFMQEFQRRNG